MAMLKDFLPAAARDVEDAPLPDLASAILEVLKTAEMSLLNRHNFMSHVGQEYGSYRQSHDADVVQACGEAWSWLVSQGFIYDRSENWVALTRKANHVLYTEVGLQAARRALRPRGVLAVWSAWPDTAFEHRLRRAGFAAEAVSVPARGAAGGPLHTIFVAAVP